MKRLGNIYHLICDYGNLVAAFGNVQRGKRGRADIEEWRNHLEERLNNLAQDLENGDFRLGDYRGFKVFDPKERTIHAAAVRERVIHHAVINVCGKWLEAGLIDDCYACRVGKGQLAAVKRAQMLSRRYPWCLKLDIKSYFDSIDQGILMAKLCRRFKDPQVLALFKALLESYATAPGKGLPIGNLTSQYFANLYLDDFDRWASATGKRGYLRYMDDMLVFGEHDDVKSLWQEVGAFLRSHLALTIKNGGAMQPVRHGVAFLGYRVFPHCLLLTKRSKERFRRKTAVLDGMLARGECSQEAYQARMTALTAFVQHADTYHLRGTEMKKALPHLEYVFSLSDVSVAWQLKMLIEQKLRETLAQMEGCQQCV